MKPFSFAIAQQHAQNHRRPVVALGSASARVNRHDSIAFVVGSAQHAPHFEALNSLLSLIELGQRFLHNRQIVGLLAHRNQHLGIVEPALLRRQCLHNRLVIPLLAHLRLRLVAVIPKTGLVRLRIDALYLLFGVVDVKDTSATRQNAPEDPSISMQYPIFPCCHTSL